MYSFAFFTDRVAGICVHVCTRVRTHLLANNLRFQIGFCSAIFLRRSKSTSTNKCSCAVTYVTSLRCLHVTSTSSLLLSIRRAGNVLRRVPPRLSVVETDKNDQVIVSSPILICCPSLFPCCSTKHHWIFSHVKLLHR